MELLKGQLNLPVDLGIGIELAKLSKDSHQQIFTAFTRLIQAVTFKEKATNDFFLITSTPISCLSVIIRPLRRHEVDDGAVLEVDGIASLPGSAPMLHSPRRYVVLLNLTVLLLTVK